MTPSELDIRELQDPDSDLARQAFAIYEESFPEEERSPVESIATAIRQQLVLAPPVDRIDHFWITVDQETVAGLAMFTYYRDLHMAFIPYIVIRADLRGQGYGSILFQRLVEQLPYDASKLDGPAPLGVCFEVERPEDAPDKAEQEVRERRIRFYQRNGAQLITQVDFVAPPLAEGLPPVPYYLMFRPVDSSHVSLTKPVLRTIIETVLLYGYELQPDDPYFQETLTSLTRR